MAKPVNPLDEFVTYTYHFELHAAPTWEELEPLKTGDANLETDADKCNKTLIINTRKDAHVSIDDVTFTYKTPPANEVGLFTADGDCNLSLTEPNGAQFVEKLIRMYNTYKVSTLQSLIFVLKIFFVGRTINNQIKTRPMNGFLCLQFLAMTADFSYRGGQYTMRFGINTSNMMSSSARSARINDETNNMALSMGYFPKTVNLKSLTIKEALSELETKLNNEYSKIYDTELSTVSRKLKYFIHVDGDVDGKITVLNRETTAPDQPATISCDPAQPILAWIYNIVRSSRELNERVGSSRENLYKEGQPGVELISVHPRFLPKAGVVEIHFDVRMYKGKNGDMYEFDFMFSEPGKNVDVINFDIHFNQMHIFVNNNSVSGVDHATSASAEVQVKDPTQFVNNIVRPDVVQEQQNVKVEPTNTNTQPNDIAPPMPSPRTESTGQIKHQFDAVPAARLMFAVVEEAHSAIQPQLSFTIRGHQELLERGLIYPDGSDVALASGTYKPLGVLNPTYVKVNINSPDEGHQPFFYTGNYQLMAIQNHFSGGRFTQTLAVTMLSKAMQ